MWVARFMLRPEILEGAPAPLPVEDATKSKSTGPLSRIRQHLPQQHLVLNVGIHKGDVRVDVARAPSMQAVVRPAAPSAAGSTIAGRTG